MRVQEANGTSLWDIQVTFAREVSVEGLRWKPTDWLTRDLASECRLAVSLGWQGEREREKDGRRSLQKEFI